MRAARTVGRSWRALAPLSTILLLACATPLLAVDDVMAFQDGRTRFVAFVKQERGWILRGVPNVDGHFIVDGREVAAARGDERGSIRSRVCPDALAPAICPKKRRPHQHEQADQQAGAMAVQRSTASGLRALLRPSPALAHPPAA